MVMEKRVEAYILIVVMPGLEAKVLKGVTKIEGVTDASLIYGPYDIHCKIQVENMDKLKEVIREIRKLDVITTETTIIYKKPTKKHVSENRIRKLWRTRARH